MVRRWWVLMLFRGGDFLLERVGVGASCVLVVAVCLSFNLL